MAICKTILNILIPMGCGYIGATLSWRAGCDTFKEKLPFFLLTLYFSLLLSIALDVMVFGNWEFWRVGG